MNPRIAFPFLQLSAESVVFSGWLIGDPGKPLLEAEDMLQDWDYERDLEISAELSVDIEQAAASLQVPKEGLQLRVVLAVGTGVGGLPRRQLRFDCGELLAHQPSVQINAVIPGRSLSGRLHLVASVLYDRVAPSSSPLSPVERGSRLWESRHDLLLEDGGDSRFPMETVSFSAWFKGLPQERAPWYLHWSPGALQADFSGSVRLYVNSDQADVASRFCEGDPLTLQSILGDVMCQMISSVIDGSDCEEVLEDCDVGSVGHQVDGWIGMAFPDQDVAAVRAMRDQFPGRFHAAVFALAEMGAANV